MKQIKKPVFKLCFISGVVLLLFSYKRPDDNARVAGLQVPEGFTIEQAVPADLLSYPMFASFDDQGRLFVFESTGPNTMGTEQMLKDPTYHIRLLEDTDADGKFDKSTIYADKLPFPKGGAFFQGSLYVTASPDLLRLKDTNGDGVADEREVIITGWTLNSNGAALGGPFMGPDGWLYMTDARRGFNIKTQEGEQLTGKGARIWRCRPDGSRLEWMSGGGFDNSIEIAFMPSGETMGTMTYFTDPKDGFRDAIMHWVEGGVYPKPNAVIAEDKLPLTGELMPVMSKLPRVAPSGIMRYKGDGFGREYANNLFCAEFNTGRVIRYELTQSAATYSATATPFLTSGSPDSHPTDVLQDADGSLLVLLTGGWFIEGCPLSRVAKPNVFGGIYRIRKNGAPVSKDPWGRKLNLEKVAPSLLVRHLEAPGFAVPEKAAELLVARGASSVKPLQLALKSKREDVRIASVFALYRIGTPDAMASVRGALADKSPLVRTAAARVCGLARDLQAVAGLSQILKTDHPAVVRQAATALGQIGNKAAVPALLQAAAKADDRFVEHAIINSLMKLRSVEPLIAALNHPSVKVRRSAVIALDQMSASPLKKEQMIAFLSGKDPLQRKTGMWLAAHHPEWSDAVVAFLEKRFAQPDLAEEEIIMLRDLMVTFSADKQLQHFVTRELSNTKLSPSARTTLFNVIEASKVRELPQLWVSQLANLLKTSNDEVRLQIISLIESRRINTLAADLNEIVNNSKNTSNIRLNALGARLMSAPQLSEKDYEMLLAYLSGNYSSIEKQSAARLLVRATLTDTQLIRLAQELPKAELYVLPGLVESFNDSKSEETGKQLVSALLMANDRLDNISEQNLHALLSAYPPAVQEAARPLFTALQNKHAERLSRLKALESELVKGDIVAGRKLFYSKAACFACHAVGSEGNDFGPDLSNIGDIRSKEDILEAILFPSASFAREYDTYKVVTAKATYTGVIAEQLSDAIILKNGPGPGIRVPRAEITAIEQQPVSMMPPGLDQQLTKGELSDLIAYLQSLPDLYKKKL